jgi:pimeloyl-ACP methyl ester carboxylesterase
MRLPLLILGLALSTVLSAAAQDSSIGPSPKVGEVVVEAASASIPDHGEVAYELGTLYVPENRSDPDSRVIGVGFARFPAAAKTDAPPIFVLPGGPANSIVSNVLPGRSRLQGQIKDLLPLRAFADVVLVDQRGFSERGEVLRHRFQTPSEPLDEPTDLKRATAGFAEMARAAVEEFKAKEIDLRGYTVIECADDVDDLRQALGYERITLMGGSFGSQWSFAFMRRHPDRVARALLSGVEPLDCGYDMPSHVMAAIARMWWEAEQDPKLAAYLPPGGLMAAARDVVRRLEHEPLRVELKGVTDAKTGDPLTITLGPEDFRRVLATRGAEGPAFVLSLYHGHYEEWALAMNAARRGRPADFPLIGPLIDTSLGVTPRRRYLLETDPATALLGRWNFDSYLATADIWPSPDVGDEFRTESASSIPVVFVQGDWDTQTPVENALAIAPYFRNGRVLLVERGGHGALGQVAANSPVAMQALLEFAKTGDAADVPMRVSVPGLKFSLPGFPPPAK